MEIDNPIIDNKQLFDDDIVSDDRLYLKSINNILRDRYKSLNSNFVAIRTDYSCFFKENQSTMVVAEGKLCLKGNVGLDG
jgi:hypothetical protein